MAAFTIALPPATQAKIDSLIDDLRTAVQKVSALADAITTEIPQLQTSIQEVADAAKKFKVL
jgi:hypothetical protein